MSLNSLMAITEQALRLWNDKNSKKYLEELYNLKQRLAHERAQEIPDDNLCDSIERSISWLSDLAASEIRRSTSKNM